MRHTHQRHVQESIRCNRIAQFLVIAQIISRYCNADRSIVPLVQRLPIGMKSNCKLTTKSWIDIRTKLFEFFVTKQIVSYHTPAKRNTVIHVELMLRAVLPNSEKRRAKSQENYYVECAFHAFSRWSSIRYTCSSGIPFSTSILRSGRNKSKNVRVLLH